jgi:hypothetical protein
VTHHQVMSCTSALLFSIVDKATEQQRQLLQQQVGEQQQQQQQQQCGSCAPHTVLQLQSNPLPAALQRLVAARLEAAAAPQSKVGGT